MDVDVAVDHRAPGEAVDGRFPDRVSLERAGGADRSDGCFGVVDEEAGHTVGDELGHRAAAVGDDRCAACQCLDDAVAERLVEVVEVQERVRPTEHGRTVSSGHRAEVADRVAVDVGCDLFVGVALTRFWNCFPDESPAARRAPPRPGSAGHRHRPDRASAAQPGARRSGRLCSERHLLLRRAPPPRSVVRAVRHRRLPDRVRHHRHRRRAGGDVRSRHQPTSRRGGHRSWLS